MKYFFAIIIIFFTYCSSNPEKSSLSNETGVTSRGGSGELSDLDKELFNSASDTQTEKIEELIKKGANPNALDKGSWTPLMVYALYNNHKGGEILIQNGADVNASNDSGKTPLHFSKGIEFTNLLLKNKATPNPKDHYGATPLHLTDKIEIAETLIANGADINLRDEISGWTPLIYSTVFKNTGIVKLLIDKSADVNLKDSLGNSPLFYAKQKKSSDIEKLLISKGASL